MASADVEQFIRESTPEQIDLYLALLRLIEALEGVSQQEREGALEIVYTVVEGEKLSVWEEAVSEWE